MSNKFKIYIWDKNINIRFSLYKYQEYYKGKSFIMAIINLLKAKRKGFERVKLEWV